MDRKAIWIIGLFLLALPIAYAATCSFYESAGYLDMAAESSEILNVSETDYCYCSSCVECTNALNNPNCTYVQLVSDIINYSTTCINNPAGFVNKTFDYDAHTDEESVADGTDAGHLWVSTVEN